MFGKKELDAKEKQTMRPLLEKCIENFKTEYKIQEGTFDIPLAVDKAYGDMTPRTIKGHTADIKPESTAALIRWFEEYFDSSSPRGEDFPHNKKEFEDAHKEACGVFLKSFNEAARQNGVQEQAFGKAQKIVNMSFKYLYCMSWGKMRVSKFTFCHMPLDSYTLNWFYRTEKENGTKISKKETWSNLTPEQYYSIADKIKSYVDTQFSGLSPLEAEFIIWPIEKSMVSLKELRSAISRSCSDQIIAAYLGKGRIESLQEIGKVEALTFEKARKRAEQGN